MSGYRDFTGKYLRAYDDLVTRLRANTITQSVFNSQLQNITTLQNRYNQAKAKAKAKRQQIQQEKEFDKQQQAEFEKILLKEQEKEAQKIRKTLLKQQADLIARQEVERVRFAREEKERKQKEKTLAKQLKSKFSNVLKQINQPRAIPFEKLASWASIRIPDAPFTLTLKSGVANVKRHFNFHSKEHFQNWLTSIENQNTIQDSSNYQTYSDAIGTDENVFNIVIPSVEIVKGGCNNYNQSETISIETPFHSLNVYSPQTKHNNCGLKVIEYLTQVKLNYANERRKNNIAYDSQISVSTLAKIHREHSYKMLNFIDDTFDFDFDFNISDYILVKKGHYYAVISANNKIYKNEHTKRGLLTWDIETRPTNDYVMVGNQKSYILKPTVLCAYYKTYQSDNFQKLTLVTNESKDCCRQFLDWLTVQASKKHFFHCIAHNGSRFDVYFLLAQLNQQEQLHTETQLRGSSIIGLQYKSHFFKDSCCFLTNSLETLCKSFKIKQAKLTEFFLHGEKLTNKNICFYKPNLTFNDFMNLQHLDLEYWNEYIDYCMMDCISLFEIWTSFNNQFNLLIGKMFEGREGLLKNVKLMSTNTIGSLAKKMLENTCLRKIGKNYVKKQSYNSYLEFLQTDGKNDPEKIKFINQFKRGGISHTNQAGKHTHELISYDIASQYPASMMNMSIPSGESTKVEAYSPMKHGYYHLRNLKFNTPYNFKPIASKDENNVLNWSNTEIDDIFMDSFMIKYMKQNYGLISFDVVTGYVSDHYIKGNEIFGDYVTTLYNEKKRQDSLKKKDDPEYNPALRECIKLFLNSVSGKLVEDPSNYFKIQYTSDESKHQINGMSVNKLEDSDKYNTWVSAGVMVYSYSKRLLFEYVRCLPKDSDDVIHIETDSIYFNKKNNPTFIENISNYKQTGFDFYPIQIGDELGNVKVEKDTKEVSYFLGKKFYCIGDLYKIKGIPLKTIDEYGNDVKLVDESLYENIYSGKSLVKEFYTMKKSLFGEHTQISSHKMTRSIKPAMDYKLYE